MKEALIGAAFFICGFVLAFFLYSESSNQPESDFFRYAIGQPTPPDNWQLSSAVDPLEKFRTTELKNQAYSNSEGNGEFPWIVVRCRNSAPEAYIYWGGYIASAEATVAFKI